MTLPYPNNAIWYIEASSAERDYTTYGSAVAVRLRERSNTSNNKRYLITCGHVIRGAVPRSLAKDQEAGFGPLLQIVRGWAPDSGYADGSAIELSIAVAIKPITADTIPVAQRIAADDWVVLEFADEQSKNGAECVQNWTEPRSEQLAILGYPGGKASFPQFKVIPTVSDAHRLRDVHQGVLRLNGTESRPGMSGGGVFDDDGNFVGIHRARSDNTLQVHAVSAEHIREQLLPAYEPVFGSETPSLEGRKLSFTYGVALVAVVVVLIAGIWWRYVRDDMPVTNHTIMQAAVARLCRPGAAGIQSVISEFTNPAQNTYEWSGTVSDSGNDGNDYLLFLVSDSEDQAGRTMPCTWRVYVYFENPKFENPINLKGRSIKFRGRITDIMPLSYRKISVRQARIESVGDADESKP